MSDLEQIGGRVGVERIMGAFIDRCFDDFIIGFLFAGRDRDRIVKHEVEMSLRMLGEDVAYTGRPLGTLHKPLRINQGHHRRRLAVLRTVLTEHQVPEDVVAFWLAYQERFRAAVTIDRECAD